MKLNIQLFADGAGTMTYDKAGLESVRNTINDLYKSYEGTLDTIKTEISNIANVNFGTDNEINEQIQQCLKLIENAKLDQLEAMASYTDFLNALIAGLSSNENALVSELGAWAQTFQTVITGVKAAYTAEGAEQGLDTVTGSVKEIAGSALKISQSTRTIVNEATNILVNSGRLVKGVTGQSPQQLVQTGIGTMKTLLGSIGSGGSMVGTASSLFNALGGTVKAFAGFLA